MSDRWKGWRARLVEECILQWTFFRVLLPRFRFSLGIFAGVNLLGALVICSAQPELSFPHALYSALALNFFEVSDSYPQGGGIPIQAVYFLLPLVGLTVIADGMVRLGVLVFNRRRSSEEWHMALAATFTDHVVVAGLGHIGHRVARRLQRDEKLVCIEKARPEGLDLSEQVAVIEGDASKLDVLKKANVEKARAILVLTDNDLANLEIALNARELNPQIRVVLRMFNEKLGHRLVDTFGFQAVFSTSELAAPSFTAALHSSKILQTIQVSPEKAIHMARLDVAVGSRLVGQTILEAERSADLAVVLHNAQGEEDLLPSPEARISAGDELYVLAKRADVDALDRLAEG